MNLGWLRKFNLKLLAVGHFVYHALDHLFDYVLYPIVMYKLGLVYGFLVMTTLSGLVCLLMAFVYDFLEKDWLGLETVKELVEKFFKEEEEMARRSWRKWWKKLFSKIFYEYRWGPFVFLSLVFDPFVTTIYIRKGYHLYNGFSKEDWGIFIGSILLSNAWWAIVAFSVVSIIKETFVRIF
jgi:hypothetical protein